MKFIKSKEKNQTNILEWEWSGKKIDKSWDKIDVYEVKPDSSEFEVGSIEFDIDYSANPAERMELDLRPIPTAELDFLKRIIDECNNYSTEKNIIILDLEKQIGGYRSMVDGLKSEIDDLESENEELEMVNEDLQQELYELETKTGQSITIEDFCKGDGLF